MSVLKYCKKFFSRDKYIEEYRKKYILWNRYLNIALNVNIFMVHTFILFYLMFFERLHIKIYIETSDVLGILSRCVLCRNGLTMLEASYETCYGVVICEHVLCGHGFTSVTVTWHSSIYTVLLFGQPSSLFHCESNRNTRIH